MIDFTKPLRVNGRIAYVRVEFEEGQYDD